MNAAFHDTAYAAQLYAAYFISLGKTKNTPMLLLFVERTQISKKWIKCEKRLDINRRYCQMCPNKSQPLPKVTDSDSLNH